MFKKIFDHFRNKNQQRRIDTEFYPDPVSSRNKDDFPARARGLVFNQIDKCTACGDCVSICPTQCIHLTAEPIPQSKKTWISTFDIDFSKCIFCGKCVDVCDPNSLIQTKEIQSATFTTKELVAHFGKGNRG